MKGGDSVKGEYDAGKSLTRKGIFWGEGGNILRGGIYFCGRFSLEIFGVRSLALGFFGESEARGHQFARVFGHGGQDILTVSLS
jgi:hypothetical protein